MDLEGLGSHNVESRRQVARYYTYIWGTGQHSKKSAFEISDENLGPTIIVRNKRGCQLMLKKMFWLLRDYVGSTSPNDSFD